MPGGAASAFALIGLNRPYRGLGSPESRRLPVLKRKASVQGQLRKVVGVFKIVRRKPRFQPARHIEHPCFLLSDHFFQHRDCLVTQLPSPCRGEAWWAAAV